MNRQAGGWLWIAIAGTLVAWFVGLLLSLGPMVNLLMVAAAVLLAVQVINERAEPS
jgi:O-antigen ligase